MTSFEYDYDDLIANQEQPPDDASYPTHILSDDITDDVTKRNPQINEGQTEEWLNASFPDARPNTIGDLLSPYGPPTDKSQKEQDLYVELGSCHFRILHVNIFLAIMTTISMVGMIVTLPIYAEYVVDAGSDLYFILFNIAFWISIIFFAFNAGATWISRLKYGSGGRSWNSLMPCTSWPLVIAIGACSAVNGLLAVYASDPTRTPPYLQAVLSSVTIPFTVLLRYAILRKGVSVIRLICCFVVLIGLLIASEPNIFNLTSSSTGGSTGPLSHRILWPCIFALSMVPVALSNVLVEKGCKTNEVKMVGFFTWVQLIQWFFLVFLFWTDLIKGFGLASNIHEFGEHFKIGMECHFGQRSGCDELHYVPWIFIGCYAVANLCSFLLTKYAEGAIYTSIVMALATPLAALFWSVFASDPFRYDPDFTAVTVYTIVGLVFMVPGTMFYNFFSLRENKEEEEAHLADNIFTIDDRLDRKSDELFIS